MTTRWCFRILHEEFGPLEFEELVELALSGTLGPGDLVRREAEDVWTAARKCPELQTAFASAEQVTDSHSQIEREPLLRAKPTTRVSVREPARRSDTDGGSQIAAMHAVRVPTSPRQRWIVFFLTLGLVLVLFLIDRLIASATPTFPQPRRVREQLAGLYWFLGTGPWSQGECVLLWIDSLVILFFTAWGFTRRLTP